MACYIIHSPFFFWSLYGDGNLFTICGRDWARKIPRTKEWDHEIPKTFWLPKDYIIEAKDHQIHIYHKWRERHHELNNLISHFQPCSPYTLQKKGIGDCFYELPRMAHFFWMIAWRLEFLIAIEAPNIYHLSCLKEANGKHMTLSKYLPLFHDKSYLVYPPKENLYSWEETYPLEIL